MKCNCSKYSSTLLTLDDINNRCNADGIINSTLEDLLSFNFRKIKKCQICNQLWCQEYPFSEMQGGGPSCSYQIETNSPENWIRKSNYLTNDIRQWDEDQSFYNILGDESNDEKCKKENCARGSIPLGVFCKIHHFEMIKKKPCPFND